MPRGLKHKVYEENHKARNLFDFRKNHLRKI